MCSIWRNKFSRTHSWAQWFMLIRRFVDCNFRKDFNISSYFVVDVFFYIQWYFPFPLDQSENFAFNCPELKAQHLYKYIFYLLHTQKNRTLTWKYIKSSNRVLLLHFILYHSVSLCVWISVSHFTLCNACTYFISEIELQHSQSTRIKLYKM